MEIDQIYKEGRNPDLWNLKQNLISSIRFQQDTTENQAKEGKDIQGMSFTSRYPRSKKKKKKNKKKKDLK